jgi:hypothetical protein
VFNYRVAEYVLSAMHHRWQSYSTYVQFLFSYILVLGIFFLVLGRSEWFIDALGFFALGLESTLVSLSQTAITTFTALTGIAAYSAAYQVGKMKAVVLREC